MELVYHDLSRIEEVQAFIQEWENSSAFIHCRTSGSTGHPKPIKLPKKLILKSAERTINYLGLGPGMKAGLALSLNSIGGKLMVIRALLARMELHVLPVCKNPLDQVQISLDFIALVPLQAMSYITSGVKDHQGMTVLIGGAPLTSVQHQAIQSYWKHAFQSYGMTETASHVALRKITPDEDAPYLALDGITFKTQDARLFIACEDLEDGGFLTTDCVELLSPQTFKYLGRMDFVINSGGKKIHPELLEQKLKGTISGEYMILPFEDASYGQGVGLVLTERNEDLNIDRFKHIPSIESHEIPRKYVVVDQLKRGASDKLDRKGMNEESVRYVWSSIL
ncbi:MAG: AMP-binding protein [Flavobacteriales bacterium]